MLLIADTMVGSQTTTPEWLEHPTGDDIIAYQRNKSHARTMFVAEAILEVRKCATKRSKQNAMNLEMAPKKPDERCQQLTASRWHRPGHEAEPGGGASLDYLIISNARLTGKNPRALIIA